MTLRIGSLFSGYGGWDEGPQTARNHTTTRTRPSGPDTTTYARLARNQAVSTRLHDDDLHETRRSPDDYLSGLCLPLTRGRDGRIAVYIAGAVVEALS